MAGREVALDISSMQEESDSLSVEEVCSMGLSQLLASLLGTDRVDELARRIAERSQGAVWQRVAHRIDALAGSEARGYVRARARPRSTA
jgi:hypothetical protein